MRLDRFDRTILQELERDGRQSFADLGERIGLSKAPCWKRVQVLEKAGVIRGYRAVLDPEALGLSLKAFVAVRVSFDKHAEFEAAVQRHPSVLTCDATTGEADYHLTVATRCMSDLDQLLRQDLCRLPGVQRFATTVALRAIKSDAPLSGLAQS